MKLMAPKDEEELRHMLYTAVYMDGPVELTLSTRQRRWRDIDRRTA